MNATVGTTEAQMTNESPSHKPPKPTGTDRQARATDGIPKRAAKQKSASRDKEPEPADPNAPTDELDCAHAEKPDSNSSDRQVPAPENISVANKSETSARKNEKNEKACGEKGTRVISVTEEQAYKHARMIASNIKAPKGRFFKDEEGRFYVQLGGKMISLDE